MTIKQLTYNWLDSLPKGFEFSGWGITNRLNAKHFQDNKKHTGTYLRMVRYYRKETGKCVCINRNASLYKIVEGDKNDL